ncbi:hypothetical protein K438DRAFT_1784981 [Mycena galopus ATCC 62051]|nr:hypothetical protein K438DRAFT_1784981 [Mycena galopus ATCC 62051]
MTVEWKIRGEVQIISHKLLRPELAARPIGERNTATRVSAEGRRRPSVACNTHMPVTPTAVAEFSWKNFHWSTKRKSDKFGRGFPSVRHLLIWAEIQIQGLGAGGRYQSEYSLFSTDRIEHVHRIGESIHARQCPIVHTLGWGFGNPSKNYGNMSNRDRSNFRGIGMTMRRSSWELPQRHIDSRTGDKEKQSLGTEFTIRSPAISITE